MDMTTLQRTCQEIVRSCDTLDFPLFSSTPKKQAILQQQRERIDCALDALCAQVSLPCSFLQQQRETLWNQACTDAREKFRNLDEKHLLNGFYLQEVTHQYAELQTALFLARAEQPL